ncbi:MAG: hypothetical protein INR64_02685 [Caulobacteraceae bacterium]|nr:hypothetical protein [Caulobacter sp.]
MVAPFLILLLLAVADFAPSFVARFKAAHANGSFGDLVAQSSAMQPSDLTADYAAAPDVMAPFPSDTLNLRITNVYSDGKGHAFVYWSCGQGSLLPLAAKSQVKTTPTGASVGSLLSLSGAPPGYPLGSGANTSYVMTESAYTYSAPAQFILKGAQTMTSVMYLYPRQSAYVGFPWDGNANDPPPAPTTTTRVTSLTLSNGAKCNYAY